MDHILLSSFAKSVQWIIDHCVHLPRAFSGSSKILGESSSNIEAPFGVATAEGFVGVNDFFTFGFGLDSTSANMSSEKEINVLQ